MAFSSRMVVSDAASMPGRGSHTAMDRYSCDILRDYSFWREAVRLRGGDVTALASSAVTVCRRMKLVEPEAWRVPATTPSTSPALSNPRLNSSCSATSTMWSVESARAHLTGCAPQYRLVRWATGESRVEAEMAARRRSLDRMMAELHV